MTEIFVDTSTWGHWFDWQGGANFADHPDIQKDVETFERIYDLVSSQPEQFIFLYNARVYHPLTGHAELLEKYFERFEQILSANLIKKIPIPCTRFDGHFFYDGSLLAGGEFGGSLIGLLSLHNDHEETLKQH
jgi:hypothetical protein